MLENGREYRWFQRGGGTHQFAYGSREYLAALGLANLNMPEQRRRNLPEERVERHPAPASPPPSTSRPDDSEDDATLPFDFSSFVRSESDKATRDTPRMTLRDIPVSVESEQETEPIPTVPNDARGEDLKTLEAVLNMSLSDFADDLPPSEDDDIPLPELTASPSSPLTADVSSALEGLLDTDISGAAKRRRRRGGRGRGRKHPDGTEESGDASDDEDDNETGGELGFAPPNFDDNEDE